MNEGSTAGTLVGRAPECDRIDALLGRVRGGASGALLLLGDPGIGKTALLAHAAAHADGMTRIGARGVESESELPYSGLLELLRPLLDRLPTLPARQADALASALAIGPATRADPFAIAAATLTLLGDAAADGPLLIVLDDLQWLDAASSEAILFAIRRLVAEPVGALLAARTDPSLRFDALGIPVLVIGPLDRAASVALLDRAAPGPRPGEVTERLLDETGGNPLALLELPRVLRPEDISGARLLDESPLRVSELVERAYAARVAALPADTRLALLVAAACDHPSLDLVAATLRLLGSDPDALGPAELAGLVGVDGSRVVFRHPLVRSAVYYREDPARRREVHGRVAKALASMPAGGDGRRAWHLAAAALGPDESVAAALEEAARSAAGRSGHAAAARAFERAAELSPQPDAAALRLLDAAHAWEMASSNTDHAVGLLDRATSLTRDPLLLARIEYQRGRIDTWRGPAFRASERLRAGAVDVIELDPALASAMLGQAAAASITAGDLDLGIEAAARGYELGAALGGSAELVAALQLGKLRVLVGDAMTGLPLLLHALELAEVDDAVEHASIVAQASPALLTVEAYALADALLTRVVEVERGANALSLLAYSLGGLAELQARTGRWTESYANGSEACLLARESRLVGQLSYDLARLARVEAARGLEDACRDHVGEAFKLAESVRFGSTVPFAESALGLLELGLGHADEAIAHLDRTRDAWARAGFRDPGRLEWEGDLIESYIRSGRTDEAVSALAVLEDEVARFVRPLDVGPEGTDRCALASAVAARCRGLLAPSDRIDDAFVSALVWHDRTTVPFERARSELCYGEQLRRVGRRIDAREHLRSALDTFDRLDATPWLERARSELAATGERLVPARRHFEQPLTPQELQVALIVSKGATNREAAAALFLTPKTIEFHLAKIYRKLDLRSRTELARWAGGHLGADGIELGRALQVAAR